LTLDDLESRQYCNRNSIGCSASSLATAGLLCLKEKNGKLFLFTPSNTKKVEGGV